MSRNQYIAVFVGLGLLTYLLFSGPIMNLFSTESVETNNNQNIEMPVTGFNVEEVVLGEGNIAERGDTISVHYVGTLTDGKVFDSSLDTNTPFTFTLGAGAVIRGWDEGLQGMRVGGKRRLVISPEYAYGNRGIGPIPPNSTLVFDVELLKVDKATTATQ